MSSYAIVAVIAMVAYVVGYYLGKRDGVEEGYARGVKAEEKRQRADLQRTVNKVDAVKAAHIGVFPFGNN